MTYGSPPRRTRGRVRERSTEQRQAHGSVRGRGASASQRGSGACASSLGSASQSRSGNDRSAYRRGPARRAGAETAERTACRVVMTTGLRTGQWIVRRERRGAQTRVAARLARVGRGRGSIPRLAGVVVVRV